MRADDRSPIAGIRARRSRTGDDCADKGGVSPSLSVLDQVLPVYHFHEVHCVRVHASPARVFAALADVTAAEIRLFRVLMTLRSLPARLTGQRGGPRAWTQPLLPQFLASGFVALGSVPDREVVFGAVSRFWQPRGGDAPRITDAAAFHAFARPDYGKAAINFSVTERPDGRGLGLRTETRIMVPDRGARRKFALYWRVIRPGSALIRRSWLRAIRRRAERPSNRV